MVCMYVCMYVNSCQCRFPFDCHGTSSDIRRQQKTNATTFKAKVKIQIWPGRSLQLHMYNIYTCVYYVNAIYYCKILAIYKHLRIMYRSSIDPIHVQLMKRTAVDSLACPKVQDAWLPRISNVESEPEKPAASPLPRLPSIRYPVTLSVVDFWSKFMWMMKNCKMYRSVKVTTANMWENLLPVSSFFNL